MTTADSLRVIVYGASGALGKVIVNQFKSLSQPAWICAIDLVANADADCSIVITETSDLINQSRQVCEQADKILHGKVVDAILCVAGGWAGGNASSADFIKSVDMMFKQSLWSSTIAAQLAGKFLKPGGLLQLTGAEPALGPTAFMIGYGSAKAAVIQMTKSLGDPTGGLPKDATCLAILPVTLDTPMNRKNMPNADFSTWTSLECVASLLQDWSINAERRPKSGALVQLITSKEGTTLIEK